MAMIESNWSMNVAKATGRTLFGGDPEYRHFCRVELGNPMPEEVKAKAIDIRNRFPAPEFSVRLERVECTGREVPIGIFAKVVDRCDGFYEAVDYDSKETISDRFASRSAAAEAATKAGWEVVTDDD